MKAMQAVKRAGALALAGLTLWAAGATVGSRTLQEATSALRRQSPAAWLVRWELGDVFERSGVSLPTALALLQSPMLRYIPAAAETAPQSTGSNRPEEEYLPPEDAREPETPAQDDPPAPPPGDDSLAEGLTFTDNGVPAETVAPAPDGYTVAGGVLIRNRSDRTLPVETVASGDFAAKYPAEGPQVLIYHTHGSEAYSLPPGQSYHSTGSYRSDDASVSVVGVGDEIAAVLSSYGISVLHDRTRYDDPSYTAAYSRSGDAVEAYLAKYPSLVYLIDVHRDAVQNEAGQQFKLVSAEDPRAAQLCLVMGVNHDGWEQNLTLAAAVQRTLQADRPTLMRPISLLNANYNQNFSRGSMLLEVGAAGNSPEEAVYAGRLFAKGLAETILAAPAG
ncbi:MAG: stage II sporulation protein P [Oscillospiraceae bacterium]|nr:stage II sporulation protein P [Oscillospiraceae bacterium]